MLSNGSTLLMILLTVVSLSNIEAHAATTEVNVKPKTCAVIEAGKPCHIKLNVSYQLDTLEKTCIWIALREQPERCFSRLEVAMLLDLTLTQDTQIFIKDLNDKILDQFTIQVATYQPVNTRKRRGLNWNLL